MGPNESKIKQHYVAIILKKELKKFVEEIFKAAGESLFVFVEVFFRAWMQYHTTSQSLLPHNVLTTAAIIIVTTPDSKQQYQCES